MTKLKVIGDDWEDQEPATIIVEDRIINGHKTFHAYGEDNGKCWWESEYFFTVEKDCYKELKKRGLIIVK